MKTSTTDSTSASTLEIVVSDFKPYAKNTLVGFITLHVPAVGLSLHECTFHRCDDGKARVGFPARGYVQDGQKKWKWLVDTASNEWHYRFQHVAVKAVEEFLANQEAPSSPQYRKR